jgi:hypothetical protein
MAVISASLGQIVGWSPMRADSSSLRSTIPKILHASYITESTVMPLKLLKNKRKA